MASLRVKNQKTESFWLCHHNKYWWWGGIHQSPRLAPIR